MTIRKVQDKITPELKALEAKLEPTTLQRRIGIVALAGVLRNFQYSGRSKSGGTGTWAPLAKSTQALRRQGKGGGGNKPLRNTGLLMSGIHIEPSGKDVAIATSDQTSKYAGILHFGGVTHPRVSLKMIGFMWNAWQKTRFDMFANIASKRVGTRLNVKIPARPYMMVTSSDIEEMKMAVAEGKG